MEGFLPSSEQSVCAAMGIGKGSSTTDTAYGYLACGLRRHGGWVGPTKQTFLHVGEFRRYDIQNNKQAQSVPYIRKYWQE